MRFFHLLTLIGPATAALAQQGVLQGSEMPPIGTTITYRTVQNLAVIDTSTGVGVAWSMADILPTTQSPWDVVYMAPAASPHPSAFPTSNYCQFESVIPRYNYYDLDATSLEKVGSWATNQNTFTDGQVELTFPLQYGSTNSDTWDNTNSSFGGTYDIACIGSGELVLPSGTFEDVLLIRINAFEIFSIVMYQWLDATNGAQLLIYYPGDGVWVPQGAAYLLDASIGIEEPGLGTDLRMHGVIGGELLTTYTSARPLMVRIRAMSGQLLGEDRWPASPAPTTRALSVEQLAVGAYVLELIADDGSRVSSRFVKP